MCDTEVYTIRVDTINTDVSNVNFTSYINIPLRNVIKAELLSASINANVADSPQLYIYVPELVSKFNDRADLQYTLGASGSISTQGSLTTSISNVQCLKTALVAIPTDQVNPRTIYTASSGFPTDVVFIEPIRQLKTLTVTIYKSNGEQLADPTGHTFLTFRFTCSKPNACLYADRGGVPLL
jgi:hypothetical protein